MTGQSKPADDPTAIVHRSSFDACRTITAQADSSFPLAFMLLPARQRRGMDALYAWLRTVDDIADGSSSLDDKRAALAAWRRHLITTPDHPGGSLPSLVHGEIAPALHATIRHFRIPVACLEDVLDGVESDLVPHVIETFDDLERYCRRVASAVGLACLAIWGVHDTAAQAPAIDAGIAFQLTNILRDLAEDRRNGRVYLPRVELHRFHCEPESWSECPKFSEMMAFQIDRARDYYRRGMALQRWLPRRPRAMFATMSGIYQALLETIARRPTAVLTQRIRISRLRKARILLLAALR